MECQVVGTPVITTNFTAMGDYTKLGRSVPHRQMISSPQITYAMAMPDVIGIADALGEIYGEYQAMNRGEKEALARREAEVLRFNGWIDKTCSPKAVGDKFKDLLHRANLEFANRENAKKALFPSLAPLFGGYEIVSGYHIPIVDWDTPWTLFAPDGLKIVNPQHLHHSAWMVYLQSVERTPMVIILPAKYEDGTDVPFRDEQGGIHDDLPVLVSTFMVTALQGQMSRRKSLLPSAIQNSGEPVILRQGLAIIERTKVSGNSSSQFQRSEL